MNPWALLLTWVAAHFIQVALGIVAYRQHSGPPGQLKSLWISAVSSVLPIVALLLFIAVFVVGRSSNVAQLAGAGGHELWRLWLHAWPFFIFGIPLAAIASIIAVLMPPYSLRTWPSTACRAIAVLAICLSYIHVVKYFPDA